MRRFLIRALVVVGVLTATAVLDLTPRAAAGYLTVAAPAASASLGDSDPTSPTEPSPVAHRLVLKDGLPVAVPQQSGGMSTTGSSQSGGDGPVTGIVSTIELPTDGRVVYYREPSSQLQLSQFIDPLLDPPRGF